MIWPLSIVLSYVGLTNIVYVIRIKTMISCENAQKYKYINCITFTNWQTRLFTEQYAVEWIPKWQNKIDAWFSGRLFSKMVRKSWIFHISHNRKLCMGQKWQKLQIQDLLNEVYPKGLIFKMTLFSPIDLDKIMPKNPK